MFPDTSNQPSGFVKRSHFKTLFLVYCRYIFMTSSQPLHNLF
jgi:hypothetical protein